MIKRQQVNQELNGELFDKKTQRKPIVDHNHGVGIIVPTSNKPATNTHNR